MALMTMEKKEIESFKEYVHRWRDVALQVHPYLMEKETTCIFVNTLSEPYYKKMIENAMRNFTEMVWSRKLIEHRIKNKKIKGYTICNENHPNKEKRMRSPTNNLEGRHLMIANLPLLQIISHLSNH